MRPWTIDADDIQIADDFSADLLHRTSWITSFLETGRDDKFIVVGTKGFGKTLLLKAKRILYQESGHLCLPENALLDKPVGNKVFSREQIKLYESDLEPWDRIWLTAIASSVLKHTGLPDDLQLSAQLDGLLSNQQLKSVLDHFVVLLDMPPGDVHKCAQEANTVLVPLLRALQRPVAVFIDSVDEYFNKHIHTPAWRSSYTGELSPDIWFLSQMSLVETSYQLRRITKHLKVFASVRKEAFDRLADVSPMVQQYRGSALDATYSESSLRQIFVNNILQEGKANLIDPKQQKSDPMAAFLGRTTSRHGFTGQVEDAFDYIERHTLLRPRDLMTVGQKLAAVEPSDRAAEREFKRVVNEGATEVAQEYLNEISPHLGDVDLRALLERVPSNVVNRDTLEMVAEEFDDSGEQIATGLEVFAALYEAGLVGVVQSDAITGQKVQRFLNPGEGMLSAGRALPQSTYYLIRSVLSGYMASLNPEYPDRTDRINVIGNGRPWLDPDNDHNLQRVAAYLGDGPYVYVCYSHSDAAIVQREIAWLKRRGINVWYDEGIPAGSRWSDELAARIRQASAFLYFVSEQSVVSPHCINEVSFVTDLPTPLIGVHIRETELPDGVKLMIGAKQTVRCYRSTPAVYRQQIEKALRSALDVEST